MNPWRKYKCALHSQIIQYIEIHPYKRNTTQSFLNKRHSPERTPTSSLTSWERLSCSPGCAWAQCCSHRRFLKLLILLPPFLMCWDSKYVPQHPDYFCILKQEYMQKRKQAVVKILSLEYKENVRIFAFPEFVDFSKKLHAWTPEQICAL